jgi:hypothetical protein
MSSEALADALWRKGNLRWLLYPHQRACYDAYRAWERLTPHEQPGKYPRVFVMDVGKRWGKTSSRLLVRIEDCIRNPGHLYRYTTAFAKDIEEIVGETAPALLETCPERLRPTYRSAHGRRPAGYYFPNGSALRLAGLDKNPNALRGRASHGDDISEAAFIRHLRYTVKNVLYHQYQQRPDARMCLESSAPIEPDTEYDTEFVDDAKVRGAYWYGTIDDNTKLSDEEREEFIRAAGGRENDDCKREYFNIRVRPVDSTVVPEFDVQRHVLPAIPSDVPEHRHCYTVGDPGMAPDPAALVQMYWDHLRDKLVVPRSWHKLNAGTSELAEQIREGEAWAFGGASAWDPENKVLKPAPWARWSDVDKRLIYDLSIDHGLTFAPTPKPIDTEVGSLRAGLFALRDAFKDDKIELWPGPQNQQLIDELHKGRWNERRTDFERSVLLGHLDCLMCLMYGWRNISKNLNPTPPASHAPNWFERPKHEPTLADHLRRDWRGR